MSKERSAVEVIRCIDKMPTLSTTAGKVVQIANDPATDARQVSKVIQMDPVLTGRVLRLLNSAYFALPEKISSVTRAIVMLGLNTVKNLALSTSILTNFPPPEVKTNFDTNLFWEHSVGSGVASKLLANKLGMDRNALEEFFVAGLLHDTGKLVFNQFLSKEFSMVLKLVEEKALSISEAETMVIGMTHSEAGKLLGEKWNLPNPILDVIRYHHDPYNAEIKYQRVTRVVHLGDILCKSKNIGYSGDKVITNLDLRVMEDLKITKNDLEGILGELKQEVEKASLFIKEAQKK
ncbi:MAG: HDOD domain-containing protein [Candidatus Hydrogenedentota bacterium]